MSEHSETLFLFEFVVENIRLERLRLGSERLALFLRLLDFPPLLVYQPDNKPSHVEQEEEDRPGEYVFNRGKSCVFKMNLRSLLTQLSSTPLYAMVLDVTEDSPRLVGSSLISLAKVVDRIKQGGVSNFSSRREKGLSAFCDLAGERIGTISLSYKLACLGASVLPHIADKRGFKSASLPGGHHQARAKEENKSPESFSPTVEMSELNEQTDSKILLGEDKLDDNESQNENYYEDLSAFCPPRLYYTNTAKERSRNKEVDFKFQNLDSEAFTYEDSCSEKEKEEGSSPHQKVAFLSNVSISQETSGVTPHVLREALKQLPLLNALVAELSLLTHSVHSSQAWSHGPELTATHLKNTQNCSTSIVNPPKAKGSQEGATTRNINSSKSHRKKLVYGTTKTFNLRLKQVSPVKVKHRECTGLLQKEPQPGTVTGKTKSSRKTVKSSRRKSEVNQSHGVSENIETAIQSVIAVTLKQKAQRDEQISHAQGDLAPNFHPPRQLKCVHLPSVDSDGIPPRKDKRLSRSDQSESESDDDKFKLVPRVKEKRNSRHRNPESSLSESSINGNEDVDYVNDFDSLESSDASLPSPESSKYKTAKSPVCPDLRSEETTPVPVPVKSPYSTFNVSIDSNSVQGFSDKSISSFEAQEAEEMDELGSLDFRKQHQHISELVASRLPGYTM